MSADEKEHLSLKVMRLSQPSWDPQLWPLISLGDIGSSDGSRNLETSEETINDKWLSSSHALLLPVTQGRVFSGETFSAYINIANLSSTPTTNVALQVELFLGKSRFVLFDNSEEPISIVNPLESVDCTIVHQLPESGTCMLVCSISHYIGSSSDQRSFKKSFKFTAQSPFKVAHRIAHLQDKTIIECTLQNVSQQFVFLNEASVLGVEGLECARLDCSGKSTDSVCKGIYNFRPKDSFSLLFAVSPSTPQLLLEDVAKQLPSLGQLLLQWRTESGGVGTLSDYVLTNVPRPTQPLEVRLVSFPPAVEVDRRFNVELEVINRLPTASDLVLCVKSQELEPFSLEGPSQLVLGPLGPQSSKRFSFDMLCLQPGFHSLKGIQVCDSTGQQRIGISPPCHILAY
ncbi:hypothetical protein Esti_002469 [Eimeria stiedai]